MQSADLLKQTYETSLLVINSYIGDLSDQELLMSPGEGCNPVAWQLGHLLASESNLVNAICPGKGLELPAGFAEAHTKEVASSGDTSKYYSKSEYMDLFEKSKAATLHALSELSAEDLDQPSPESFRNMFPTVGSVAVLIATHSMMHAGQFVPLRRKLGKPIVI